jgi:predicted DCC family thiol-disulfide oxidoreductase YuxK
MRGGARPTRPAACRPVTDFDPERRDAPLLVYDGDCGFCAYWARRWQLMTGDRVRFAPYQAVKQFFPLIPEAEFKGAVQLIETNGSVTRGAEACFRVLDRAPGEGHWLWLYRHIPGFAPLSEKGYRGIALRRPLFALLSRLLWGADAEPPRYKLTANFFLRLIGMIYLAAFLSLGSQILGLVGSQGILPANALFEPSGGEGSFSSWLALPSLFWLVASDAVLEGACWAGAAAALAVVLGRFTGPALLACWILYLSLFHAGQIFLNYQWDLLLLEAGFLAWLLTSGSRIPIYLLRWLLFRFMFLSGAVKLASGDPAWSSLRALKHHFETQPLPTSLAWQAHQLPDPLLSYLTAAHFAIELAVPFLVFLPRRPRFVAAAGFLVLQLAIIATGNYGYFNLLAIVLLIPLLDDQALRSFIPRAILRNKPDTRLSPRPWQTAALAAFAAFAVLAGSVQMAKRLKLRPDTAVIPALEPFHLVNPYGVFAFMVRDRREVVLEGTRDGVHWREIEFRWKPGPTDRPPRWNIPHQPRLDWQMWFAGLGDLRENDWMVPFVERVLSGSPAVLGLLASPARPGDAPLKVRAALYRYRFATPEEHRQGHWWVRAPDGEYLPPVTSETAAGALRRSGPPESFIRWR